MRCPLRSEIPDITGDDCSASCNAAHLAEAAGAIRHEIESECNEELVSVNEEMQSTNEELEASKEELQSVNEELHTVNGELSGKIDELDRSNNDLLNLFESTDVATIFLDRDLVIRSFTPAVAHVFNILPTDRGRPITDLSSRLNLPDFNHLKRLDMSGCDLSVPVVR